MRELSRVFLCSILLSVSNGKANKPDAALISTEATGLIGVSLKGFPNAGSILDRVASYYMHDAGDAFWQRLVHQQLKMTFVRQVYRSSYYDGKKQLTLPPEQAWKIDLTSRPKRTVLQNTEFVTRRYHFYSVLVGRADSLNASEPALVPIGGTWSDTWTLPVDPSYLIQRYGKFHDFSGLAKQNDGIVNLTITWTRLPYDAALAAQWRFGEQSSQTADLTIVIEDTLADLAITYVYIDSASCTLQSPTQCIKKAGWRRLLRFSTSSKNIGRTDLHVGVLSDDSPYVANGVFVYDNCHQHYHFMHYIEFTYGPMSEGVKMSFCIETTWRYQNNEYVPFSTDYQDCVNQGISVGWGDTYNAFLECQWLDVTDATPGTSNFTQVLNPDSFLCEGTPVLTPTGDPVFVPTSFSFVNAQGATVPQSRVACDYTPGYLSNNVATLPVYLPPIGSTVTQPCTHNEVSPQRDCGFTLLRGASFLECKLKPGTRVPVQIVVQLASASASVAQAATIRVCEASRAFHTTTACEQVRALASTTVYSKAPSATLSFVCPAARDKVETGGAYSILVAPMFVRDPLPEVVFEVL